MTNNNWQDKNSERRNRILKAALEVFATQGFRTAEVRTVAETAGVGKATIYKFFSSKEELLLVVVDENLAQIRDLAVKSLIGPGEPQEKLEASVLAVTKFIESNRNFTRVLIQEAGDFMGDIQKRHLEMMERDLPLTQAFFHSFPESSGVRKLPTRFIIQLIANSIIGAIYTWALTDGYANLPEKALASLRILLAGLDNDVELPEEALNDEESDASRKLESTSSTAS